MWARAVDDNRGRIGLWGPVALGAGIFIYFSLRQEPPLWSGMLWLCVACGMSILLRAKSFPAALCLLAAAGGAGFSAAQIRTLTIAAPTLRYELTGALTGRTLEVRETRRGIRMIVAVEKLGHLPAGRLPARVRVLLLRTDRPPPPGSRVELFGRFKPPPGPVAPGAYDFQRALFFEGIGGIGFALTRVKSAAEERLSAASLLGGYRAGLSERIRGALPGDAGAIASALLVGDRDWIAEPAEEAMREAGIAHLLAISGLHMGLVAGCVFAATRILLSLFARTALLWPTRAVAAVAAGLFATFYLFLSGAAVPTQRAYIMTLFVLLALLIGRKAISLRLVALAATLILLVRPDYLLGVSFQLSFAAVTGLIAAYEAMSARRKRGERGAVRLLWNWFAALSLSSLVASGATLPVALYHFQEAALYGAISNLVAIPLASFWIMPWGVAALLAMPFGLEALALTPMGVGIDLVLRLAEWVREWPSATLPVSASPFWVAGIAGGAGLWLCLVAGWSRFLALPPLLVAITLLCVPPWTPPSILVAERGREIGVRLERDLIGSARRGSFELSVWRRRAGFPEEPERSGQGFDCDAVGCVIVPSWRGPVVLSQSAESLEEDCLRADILVTKIRVPRICPAPRLIIGPRQLRAGGSAAIWLDTAVPRVLFTRDVRGIRPWTGNDRDIN